MIASLMVIPWALVFGAIRGIPLWWRCVDSMFGVFAFVPAWLCHRWASELESMSEWVGACPPNSTQRLK